MTQISARGCRDAYSTERKGAWGELAGEVDRLQLFVNHEFHLKNYDQGETYNGNVFELPMTWVTKCPEKGALTVTYSRFKPCLYSNVSRACSNMCSPLTRLCSGPNRKFMLEAVRQALRGRVV